jgi:hypothetical protein
MKRRLTFVELRQREKNEERAEKELTWFFCEMHGKVPEAGTGEAFARPAAAAIDGWLRSIPPFHRGAMALSFDDREWPETLEKAFGSMTSLVVRIECANLADGSGKPACELEARALRELEQVVAESDRRQARIKDRPRAEEHTVIEQRVSRRLYRAERHVELAIRAYAKARGNAHCVLPRGLKVNARPDEELPDVPDAGLGADAPAASGETLAVGHDADADGAADAACVDAHVAAAGEEAPPLAAG